MMHLGEPPDEIRHEGGSQVDDPGGERADEGDFSGAGGRGGGGLGEGRVGGVVVLEDAVGEGEAPLKALDGEEGNEEADRWGGGIWWGRGGRTVGVASFTHGLGERWVDIDSSNIT